ncbi:MAG: dimethyladenosine transferase [Acidimicrobiaceae bacterium]|nr:dimethyladenosine transferase [Acidimicrobiaceae bacterium]|tara:strand:- start:2885 stop:3349 length:465 start_codon:yes stop_codon:yes gene_type:complete
MKNYSLSKGASEKNVSVSRVIPAQRSEIFGVIANPFLHAEIDGSGTVRGKIRGPDQLSLGDTFQIKMRTWSIPYRITNTVVEYEKDTLIAWSHFGKHRWRYEFSDDPEGTLVTETFDWAGSIWPKMIEMMGYPKSHLPQMHQTLDRLENFMIMS